MDAGVDLPRRRKAAILCISLGPSAAASIFRHLPEDLVEQLTLEMARMESVPSQHMDAVATEVIETAYAQGYIAEGGMSYARDVLERAVGPHRAAEILRRIAVVMESTPFSFLRATPPEQIVAFLRNEHPQTVALVVANLPAPELAAKVMQQLQPELQADVALRIATMSTTPPDVVKEIAAVMAAKLENIVQRDYAAAGGVKSLAQILNSSDRSTERNILKYLGERNTSLADEVRSLLFVFEDLLKLDDRSIQLILKEIDTKVLALALRGASGEVRELMLANMSQRGSEMLREEMEFMPPQRRRDVEGAQSKIVAAVRVLEEAGTLHIQRGGDDEEEMIS